MTTWKKATLPEVLRALADGRPARLNGDRFFLRGRDLIRVVRPLEPTRAEGKPTSWDYLNTDAQWEVQGDAEQSAKVRALEAAMEKRVKACRICDAVCTVPGVCSVCGWSRKNTEVRP